MRHVVGWIAAIAVCGTGSAAHAGGLFGGVLAHDMKTGITRSGIEDGVDFHLGYRGDPFFTSKWAPSPYVFAAVNSAGDTNFAAAGLSWRFGNRLYVRPGVGLAIHDGPASVAPGQERIDFGSRILFEPEVALGYRVNDRLSVEASWVHLSHARLFSDNNPGMDTIGVRLNYRFGE